MVGRVLRAAPGKTRAVVVDLTGASHEHGLPETDRQYSLQGKAIKASDRVLIRQCRACGAAYEVGPPTCPVCGAAVPPPPRPKLARAELERIMATHTPEQKARKLAELALTSGGAGDDERIAFLWQRAVSRSPDARELAIVKDLLARRREEFKASPQAAAELLAVGIAPRDKTLNETELAAWTAAARAVLNLNETIARY